MTTRVNTSVVFLLCAACASARIDVDVYKGPLANEHEVQVQQVAALAIGAKPVLIQLRDALEGNAPGRGGARAFRNAPGYVAGYMPPSERLTDTLERRTFTSEGAESVNAVLGLYEDRTVTLESRWLASIEAAIRRYDALTAEVNSTGKTVRARDERVADWLEQSSAHGAELRRAVLEFIAPKERVWRADSAVLTAYLEGMPPKDQRYAVLEADVGAIHLHIPVPALMSKNDADEGVENLGAEVRYAILSRVPLWEDILAQCASDLPEHERASIGAYAARQAASFGASRRALTDIFESALRLVVYLDSPTGPDSSVSEEKVRGALTIAFACLSRRQMEDSIESGMFSKHNDVWRNIPQIRTDIGHEFATVLGQVSPSAIQKLLDKRGASSIRDTERAVDSVLHQLGPLPDKITLLARAMEQWNAWHRSTKPEAAALKEFWLKRDRTLATDLALANRVHGLIAAPNPFDKNENGGVTSSELREEYSSLIPDLGLDGGRLDRGIDTLVEDYLLAIDRTDSDAESPRRTLLQALSRFAEKLRILSSMQHLLGNNPESGYIDLLEAVATSITSQIDDLERSQRMMDDPHEVKQRAAMRRSSEAERFGWEQAQSWQPAPPGDGNDTETEDEGGEEAPAQSSPPTGRTLPAIAGDPADPDGDVGPKATLDQVLATLRYMLVDEVATHGDDSTRADNLRAAIDVVHEQRVGFSRLRPAAVFLRNSYPASDLQQNPLHLTGSILAHNRRSFDDPRQRRTAIALDKQYWQNVNTIRLTGVGNTKYTLAKDDIGNWQVKAYSGNTTKLVRTLKDIAMAGVGSGLSPAARIRAEEFSVLSEKLAKDGKLTGEDRERWDGLRESAEDGAQRNELLVAHARKLRTRSRELELEIYAAAERQNLLERLDAPPEDAFEDFELPEVIVPSEIATDDPKEILRDTRRHFDTAVEEFEKRRRLVAEQLRSEGVGEERREEILKSLPDPEDWKRRRREHLETFEAAIRVILG